MENQSLLLTLGLGVSLIFILFFVFYKGLKWPGKQAALVVIALAWAVYIPLGVIFWAGLDVFAIHFAMFTMSGYGLGIITNHREVRLRIEGLNAEEDKGWFHWGPATIVGFFLILVIVDSTIITLAGKSVDNDIMAWILPEPESGNKIVSQFPGTVPHAYQKKEAYYNDYMQALKVQAERGWQIEGGWVQKPSTGKAGEFRIHVADRDGVVITDAEVSVTFLRSADQKLDQRFSLASKGDGYYQTQVMLPEQGHWNMLVLITRGDDRHEIRGKTRLEP